MANAPTVGIFLPNGYVNNFNSAAPSGQVDAYGNTYPSGSTLGKMIELGDNEAANATAPGTPAANALLGGAYQIVLLDSSATAANCTAGLAAFIKLDQNSLTAGTLPETGFSTITVTDEAHADAKSLFAGVFINPATLNGLANTPTPGNYTIIWCGAGRVAVQYKASLTNGAPAIGDNIVCGGGSGTFDDAAANSTAGTGLKMGQAVTIPAGGAVGLIYARDIFYRLRP